MSIRFLAAAIVGLYSLNGRHKATLMPLRVMEQAADLKTLKR